jgi:hypothetical protein
MPGVDEHVDVVRVGVRDELQRLRHRGDEAAVTTRSEHFDREAHLRLGCGEARLAEHLDDPSTHLSHIVPRRACIADHAQRIETREPADPVAKMFEPLHTVAWLRKERVTRDDAGHLGETERRAQTALAQTHSGLFVLPARELELPEADALDPCVSVEAQIVGERLMPGRACADRQRRTPLRRSRQRLLPDHPRDPGAFRSRDGRYLRTGSSR